MTYTFPNLAKLGRRVLGPDQKPVITPIIICPAALSSRCALPPGSISSAFSAVNFGAYKALWGPSPGPGVPNTP